MNEKDIYITSTVSISHLSALTLSGPLFPKNAPISAPLQTTWVL